MNQCVFYLAGCLCDITLWTHTFYSGEKSLVFSFYERKNEYIGDGIIKHQWLNQHSSTWVFFSLWEIYSSCLPIDGATYIFHFSNVEMNHSVLYFAESTDIYCFMQTNKMRQGHWLFSSHTTANYLTIIDDNTWTFFKSIKHSLWNIYERF